MKKRFMILCACLMTLMMVFAFAGCGSSEETEESTEAATEETTVESEGAIYGYTGTDPAELAIYQYMTDNVSQNYPVADASIPVVTIINRDESNPEDVLITGDYWIYNYNVDGDTLLCASGGDHPGCMHLIENEDGTYSVTAFDVVKDGSEYDSSAQEIFGEDYETFVAVNGDEETREEIRTRTVSTYVKANDLSCTQYQDEGWDPVKLDL
ncbi:MAG: hypothetical protein IJI74_07570 [Firmicutes bacterium]|nr:hypothetical protein [Bacillota bacterium]